jgi:hypothetical protein
LPNMGRVRQYVKSRALTPSSVGQTRPDHWRLAAPVLCTILFKEPSHRIQPPRGGPTAA